MIVYIADVMFDKKQRVLSNGSEVRHLEPKVFSLLSSLVDAEGNIVTRDQLIEDVWNKRVVGEGAINRTVSLLRSHFSALSAQTMVETVPTQGYRLVADLSEIITSDSQTPSVSLAKRCKNTASQSWQLGRRTMMVAFVLCCLGVGGYAAKLLLDKPAIMGDTLSLVSGPLIGLSGWEYKLSTTDNGNTVLFHHLDAHGQSVYVYNTVTHRKHKILDNALAAISSDGNKAVYVQVINNVCAISILTISTLESTPVLDCEEPPTMLAWGKDDNFYFNRRFSKSHPYQVFNYHIKTQRLQQITNPNSSNNTRGDFKFSANTHEDKLAVIRYVSENESLVIIFNGVQELSRHVINSRLKSITWHPNNRDLVLADSTKLYVLTPDHDTYTLLKELALNIDSIAVINNDVGASLLVSDAQMSSEIMKLNRKSGQESVWQNSGRTELLPRMKADTQLVLSTRYKGHHWWQIKDNEATLVDIDLPFELKFVRYQLSNDGNRVLFTKHGNIFELDLEQKNYHQLFEEPNNSYVASYDSRDNKRVIYSSNHEGEWQLWLFERSTNKHTQLTEKGGYSGHIAQGYLYFSKLAVDGLWRKKLTSSENKSEEELVIKNFDRINWLNWQIIDNKLYFYRLGSGIWSRDLDSEEELLVMKTPSGFVHQYTVSPDHKTIFWVKLKQTAGDIYQYSGLK